MPDGSFATAAEVHYPPLMCSVMASAFVEQIVSLSAKPVASELQGATLSLNLASQIAAGRQPPGKKIPPLVPEFSQIVRMVGPANSLPTVHKGPLPQAFAMPPNVVCHPYVPSIPVGSKCIRANPHHGDHKVSSNAVDNAGVNGSAIATNFDIAVELPWTPSAFVKQACLAKHPRCLEKGVPKILSECVLRLAVQDVASVAKSRTEQLRKWYCVSKEIDETFDGPSHCQRILRSKRVNLFGKVLAEAKHGDCNLAANIQQGFDLLGKIPKSGVMPRRTTVASLDIADLRQVTGQKQRAVLDSTTSCRDVEVAKEVYRLTKEECERGWLLGPLSPSDIPSDAVLTTV